MVIKSHLVGEMHSCPPAILQVLVAGAIHGSVQVVRTSAVTLLSLAALLPGSWSFCTQAASLRPGLPLPLRSLGAPVQDQRHSIEKMGATPVV